MPAGRPRKPAEIHELEGTTRASRESTQQSRPGLEYAVPLPTEELDELEQRCYEDIVAGCEVLNSTCLADATFLTYCAQLHARYYRATAQEKADIEAEDGAFTRVTSKGDVVPHASTTLALKIGVELRQVWSRLGFTPADRTRVADIGRQASGDELDDMVS